MSQLQRTREPTVGRAAVVIGAFVVGLYAIELVDQLLANRLDQEGIRPRDDEGLLGILFAPALHAGWGHLMANTVPALVLGFLILLSGVGHWVAVTAVIWVVGGLGTWLVAPPNTVHLGASILVFGWLVFLVLRGLFSRRASQILLGIVVFLLYGGILWGVLPGQPGISWQGHLFGALGGVVAAMLLVDRETRAPGRA
jgi:membrane associated rhomboid family serine protease